MGGNEVKEDGGNKEEERVLNAEDLLKDLGGFTALKRKTTREELLGESDGNDAGSQFIGGSNPNSSNDLSLNGIPDIGALNKTISKTPEPLDRIRSDCLVRNSSQ